MQHKTFDTHFITLICERIFSEESSGFFFMLLYKGCSFIESFYRKLFKSSYLVCYRHFILAIYWSYLKLGYGHNSLIWSYSSFYFRSAIEIHNGNLSSGKNFPDQLPEKMDEDLRKISHQCIFSIRRMRDYVCNMCSHLSIHETLIIFTYILRYLWQLTYSLQLNQIRECNWIGREMHIMMIRHPFMMYADKLLSSPLVFLLTHLCQR